MARLPTIKVEQLYGFFLRPDGATGSDAIVYLPAFNDHVRNQWERKGLRLLSQCAGDFSEKGAGALRIGPPSDKIIEMVAAEISSRLSSEQERLQTEVAQAKEFLADKLLDADERKLYQLRLRQLTKRLGEIDKEQPAASELKVFFYREHRTRLAQAIPANIRGAVAAMAEEQRWAELEAQQREPAQV